MGNQALSVNPSGSATTFNLSTNGSSWLWAVYSFMSFVAIVIMALSFRVRPPERKFYYFNICVLTTAALSYFCMASNLGYAPVQVTQRGPGARQFWYVRYIDWVITTPMLLSELLVTAGAPLDAILSTIFADIVMIICGLIGGLVPSEYKWAFFVFGCVAMLWVFWNLISGIKTAEEVGGKENRRVYLILTGWLLFFWSIYPIAWGLGEGGNVISVTGEMIFYGILDICTKPLFALLAIFLRMSMKKKRSETPQDRPLELTTSREEQNAREAPRTSTSYTVVSSNVVQTYY